MAIRNTGFDASINYYERKIGAIITLFPPLHPKRLAAPTALHGRKASKERAGWGSMQPKKARKRFAREDTMGKNTRQGTVLTYINVI